MVAFDSFLAEWYFLVGNAECLLYHIEPKSWRTKCINKLCELADGETRKGKPFKPPKIISDLSHCYVVDMFCNGDYEINMRGIDVVYHMARLVK